MDSPAFSLHATEVLSFGVLNMGVLAILRSSLNGVNVRSALGEKDPDSTPPQTAPVATDAAGRPVADAALDNTSYSRLAGFIGAVVLACFLWALGNVLIFDALFNPGAISGLMSSLSGYFYTGAALFAPYAFNQLSKAFKPG